MATSLSGSITAVAAAFAAVAPDGVLVRTGWQAADEEPTVCTVGVMDPAELLEDVSSPMARVDRSPMGGTHSHDTERLAIYCNLKIPVIDDGESSPALAITAADDLIGLFAASLLDLAIPRAVRTWLGDVLVFLLDTSTGFGAAATFTVYVESYQ